MASARDEEKAPGPARPPLPRPREGPRRGREEEEEEADPAAMQPLPCPCRRQPLLTRTASAPAPMPAAAPPRPPALGALGGRLPEGAPAPRCRPPARPAPRTAGGEQPGPRLPPERPRGLDGGESASRSFPESWRSERGPRGHTGRPPGITEAPGRAAGTWRGAEPLRSCASLGSGRAAGSVAAKPLSPVTLAGCGGTATAPARRANGAGQRGRKPLCASAPQGRMRCNTWPESGKCEAA